MRNKIHHLLFFLLAGALLAAAPDAEPQDKAAAGTLQGRVLFAGKKSPQGVIVTDALVYLVAEGRTPKEALTKDGASVPVLDQRDITFAPNVLPVVAGSEVEIRNSDNITHNVHTISQKNPSFNRAQLRHRAFRVTFESPELIRVRCDIHSQMHAYIHVLPTPLFTKAGEGGTYAIAGIAPGKYELVGWHEKYGAVTSKVEIGAGKTTQADVNLPGTSETSNGAQ